MTGTIRHRLIILFLSILIAGILFALSVSRASERNLPPTPTRILPSTQQTSPIQAKTQTQPALNTPGINTSGTPAVTEPTATLESQAATATREAFIIATAQEMLKKATQRAQIMSNIIQILYKDGIISSDKGDYTQPKDFSASWNKQGWYQMWNTQFIANDFVIRANLLWDNQGEEVSYPNAGCGFVFSSLDLNNHFRVFLNLDGSVRIHRIQGGEFDLIDMSSYGTLDIPKGHAQLLLAVDQGWISVYVNNQLISHLQDDHIQEGRLAYAIASGSNFGLGTTCDFKDIELWVIRPAE